MHFHQWIFVRESNTWHDQKMQLCVQWRESKPSVSRFILEICFHHCSSHFLFIKVPVFHSGTSFFFFFLYTLFSCCPKRQPKHCWMPYTVIHCFVWFAVWSPLCLAAVDWLIGSLLWLDRYHWLMKAGGSWQHTLLQSLAPAFLWLKIYNTVYEPKYIKSSGGWVTIDQEARFRHFYDSFIKRKSN